MLESCLTFGSRSCFSNAKVIVGIFALSRPSATVTLPSNRGTVILAIDISGSMRAHDIKPSRIEAAKAAARIFIEKMDRRGRVGIGAVAGGVAVLARRGPSERFTYGMRGTSIIVSLANAMLLLVIVGGIGWQSGLRLLPPAPAAGGPGLPGRSG